jgi:hypothetical protein
MENNPSTKDNGTLFSQRMEHKKFILKFEAVLICLGMAGKHKKKRSVD